MEMNAFLTAVKKAWEGLVRNSPPLFLFSGRKTDVTKCRDPEPSLRQIKAMVEFRPKLLLLGLGCQRWRSPKIQWLHETFVVLAGDLGETVQLHAGETGPF